MIKKNIAMNQISTNLHWMELKIDWFSFNFQGNEKKKLCKLVDLFKKYDSFVCFIDENEPNIKILPPPKN